MRNLFVLLLLAMSTSIFAQTPPIEAGVPHELAKWRAVRYSDVRYKINLTLEKMSPVLKGTIEIRLKVRDAVAEKSSPPYEGGVDAALGGRGGSLIILDWRKIRGYEERSTLSNVSINGRSASVAGGRENQPVGETPPPLLRKEGSQDGPLTYAEHNEHLIFRDGVARGENVIKLDFTSPILTSGSAITRYVDKEDGAEYIYSLFVPSDASTAFPVFDQPDLKARFELFVYAPSEWQVVSNVAVDAVVQQGSSSGWLDENVNTGFSVTKPISTYVFAFAAGPFTEFDSNQTKNPDRLEAGLPATNTNITARRASPPLNDGAIFVRKSQSAKFNPHAAEVFRLNREAVKYFEQYFDYKFPFPKYDLVLIPEFPFGGMEHAGATFLRESAIIFPQEPTKNDLVSRATLIFHEAAHQWFGDTVTMRWFDDLWLKEGFATFTAYKAMEKIMPEMNAWKVFYERIKQGAYQTDSTKGTTPIYQEIRNLSAAKSAYGNIVYNKAPAFLRQAEFYLGEDKFQTAVRAFLKKHEYGNAGWEDLVAEMNESAGGELKEEFAKVKGQSLQRWATTWVRQRGLAVFRVVKGQDSSFYVLQSSPLNEYGGSHLKFLTQLTFADRTETIERVWMFQEEKSALPYMYAGGRVIELIFPNYGDYGYGIFLLDEKSRDYVLKNIQNEKDPFLRTMMWGSLWDSVREGELDPRVFVELVVRNLSTTPSAAPTTPSAEAAATPPQAGGELRATPPNQGGESDESTIATLLGRVSTAMTHYMSEPGAVATGLPLATDRRPVATAQGSDLPTRLENMLIDRMQNAPTLGQRITFYRAFLNMASSEKARGVLKELLAGVSSPHVSKGSALGTGRVEPSLTVGLLTLRTKDRFDIVTRLLILGDPDAPALLADLEKTETSDEAKRYAYAAKAGIATAENKAKYWKDFTANKEISESWIEAAFGPFNAARHAELTLPYLDRALKELPNHKRNRKIFFVNGWLAAFIGGQRSEEALAIVNKFLADNPNLDKDLRLKILENVDLIERAVKIRSKFS